MRRKLFETNEQYAARIARGIGNSLAAAFVLAAMGAVALMVGAGLLLPHCSP